jgi:hypothetical protein
LRRKRAPSVSFRHPLDWSTRHTDSSCCVVRPRVLRDQTDAEGTERGEEDIAACAGAAQRTHSYGGATASAASVRRVPHPIRLLCCPRECRSLQPAARSDGQRPCQPPRARAIFFSPTPPPTTASACTAMSAAPPSAGSPARPAPPSALALLEANARDANELLQLAKQLQSVLTRHSRSRSGASSASVASGTSAAALSPARPGEGGAQPGAASPAPGAAAAMGGTSHARAVSVEAGTQTLGAGVGADGVPAAGPADENAQAAVGAAAPTTAPAPDSTEGKAVPDTAVQKQDASVQAELVAAAGSEPPATSSAQADAAAHAAAVAREARLTDHCRTLEVRGWDGGRVWIRVTSVARWVAGSFVRRQEVLL